MASQQVSHYRIIERLGAGGMGEVFLAHDLKLERKVAIKMLPAKSIDDVLARKRLFREAKAAATLSHPNICTIHEVNEDSECPFIVMQYVEGVTLASKLRNAALAPEEVIDIGIQVAEALSEAHSGGVIHRDIKPQNVIINVRGQVKVLDFGLARLTPTEQSADPEAKTETQLTEEGYIVGTVAYMSPEQLKGQSIDARSDIFSMGVMLYECATGKAPFTGTSKIEISSKVLQVEPRKPSEINPGMPPGLEDIILKAMAKDVDARYQSADAMLKDLKRLRGSLSGVTELLPSSITTGSPRSGITDSVRMALSTPRGKLVAIAIATLIVIGGFAAYLLRPGPYKPSAEAKVWYDRGAEAIRMGSFYTASKALEQATQIDPRFALAHASLADAYFEIDYPDKAKEELLQAMSLVPNRSALTSRDGMYLDAVAATVRGDFAGAVDSYQKIADQASSAEKAKAYLDLGRAYEKNENPDKAIECYTSATKADPQSAAAFLRLGVMYGRRQDLKRAADAFDKANALYQAMTNPEGQAEVLYQHGTLFSKIRNLKEAKPLLEKALEIARSNNIQYQSVKTQLQLSSIYFAEGNSERAKEVATEAISLAQGNNIRNLATNGLIDLGYTLIWRGELNEAAKYFKQALDFAQADRARRIEARAKLALGTVNFQQGNLDQAITLLDEALKFYQPAGYRKETSITLLTLGRAQRNKGDYDSALKKFGEQLQLAKDLGDPAQLAASNLSMGILFGEYLERYPEALPYFEESYQIDDREGSKVGMASDQLYRGYALWQLGRNAEARAALEQAAQIANQPEASFKEVLAWVLLTESQMALSDGRTAEAKALGQQALDLKGSEIKDLAVRAKDTLGLARAFSGSAETAKKLCDEALILAKEGNSPRVISNALLARAEVLLRSNDAAGALADAMQAQAMFAKSGQAESEWRGWLIAARASQAAGNAPQAKDYASRADALCAGLQQKWGADAYASYLRRGDIQSYRREIEQLLSRTK